MIDTEIQLCLEYQEFCRINHLPALSAYDLMLEDCLTMEQQKYLAKFLDRWEALGRSQ